MKRFIAYLKYSYSLDEKMLRQLALESWREYIKGRPRIYDMDFCRAYQRGFISRYRHDYAIRQLESAK